MSSLDSTHPGAHEEIQGKGIFVYWINTIIWQSNDGAGEENYMWNFMTTGNDFSFLMCSGETFSEGADSFLFAVPGSHKIILIWITGIHLILLREII